MGKGDKKSRRGKIHIGSFGVRRPRKTGYVVPAVPSKIEDKPAKIAEKAKKSEPLVETEAEVSVEVKKPVRKTAKKAREESASE